MVVITTDLSTTNPSPIKRRMLSKRLSISLMLEARELLASGFQDLSILLRSNTMASIDAAEPRLGCGGNFGGKWIEQDML